MIQVIQQKGGPVATHAPAPSVRPGYVLIQNEYSVISAGTERMVLESGRASLLTRARRRPDQVRQVLRKLATEGFGATFTQVREKLSEPIALGYSSAGTVLAVGRGVQGIRPGDRVSSNGPHASVVCVPRNLCATVPDGVAVEHAAFTTLASIALQGVRLGRLGLGDTALVIGLGLLGQLTVRLLHAQGCRVIGVDLDPLKCERARAAGADQASATLNATDVMHLTRGIGADAVLITAATESNAPVQLAGDAVRARGRVVVVGAVGLGLPRQPYYLKEAEFVISCSYGPGRYDPEYEDRGHDYPAGHVRWTEQRNMQAVLDLMASGRLDVSPLVSHRFRVDDAPAAYQQIESDPDHTLGVVLRYEPEPAAPRAVDQVPASARRRRPALGDIALGFVGSGGFAKMVLLPGIKASGAFRPRKLCASGGLAASTTGQRFGFASVTADEDELLGDPDLDAVVIATRHDQHTRQVAKALRAGKHVFVEKPLSLTLAEIAELDVLFAERQSDAPVLMVGFNRRYSPAALAVKAAFADVVEPLTVSIRFNVSPMPASHWIQHEQIGGGRLIGEACHAIDLATFLVGSAPARVYAESIGGSEAPAVSEDQAFLVIRHDNGAVSSIAYLAGGDAAIPKERVEVAGGERFAIIDDFREYTIARHAKAKPTRLPQQDKGHKAEIAHFARAIADGAPTVPWRELRAVSLAAILGPLSLREAMPLSVPDAATLRQWLADDGAL